MDIGQAIKKLRVERGMSQEQLADSIGMSVNAVSTWENGKNIPPKSNIEKLCRAFGIPVSYMLMAAIEEQDIPEEKRVLYRALLEPLRNELLDVKDTETEPAKA